MEKIEIMELINNVLSDGPHPAHLVVILVPVVLSNPNQLMSNQVTVMAELGVSGQLTLRAI